MVSDYLKLKGTDTTIWIWQIWKNVLKNLKYFINFYNIKNYLLNFIFIIIQHHFHINLIRVKKIDLL